MILLTACGGDHSRASHPKTIALVPIGPVPADLVLHLKRELPRHIGGTTVTIAPAIPTTKSAFSASRNQYLGRVLLEELARQKIAADRVVGIIDADAYAPGLNFILGQSQKPGRVVVIALPRLRQSFLKRPEDPALFRERTVKVAVHELGHSMGISHCPDLKCAMHFANSVRELDRQTSQFCALHELPHD